MNTDTRNHVAVYHGPVCPSARCTLRYGDLLTETWNVGKASVDLEWTVSKARVNDRADHAGSCVRWGPDVAGETSYPAHR